MTTNQSHQKRPSATAAGSDLERLLAVGILIFALAFNLISLYHEAAIVVPPLNDHVLHGLNLERTAQALASGENPTDFWLAPVVIGYPLFHHYQHLAYQAPALLLRLTGSYTSSSGVLNWTSYLLLSLFPLSIYWSMRRFGFGYLPAALAGLVAPLVATQSLYGMEYGSYVWRGSGLYTQLWGMLLLPLALGQGYKTLKTGQGYFWAALLLAATLLAHTVFGYIAALSLAALALVIPREETGEPGRGVFWRLGRMGIILALAALLAAYFLVPFWLDRPYMNRSVWELVEKYDSYGHQWVIGALGRGELFDYGRLPVLTLLAGLGLVICLWRWREERYRVPVTLALVWLLLYFGRPTWGQLLDLLPLSADLHFHRLIAGVHLGGIYLAGVGLALAWEWALSRANLPSLSTLPSEIKEGRTEKAGLAVDWSSLLIVLVLTGLLLYPAYSERRAYLAENADWMRETQAAVFAEASELEALLAALDELPPGRVYAGQGNNWGNEYRIGQVPVYALLNRAGLDMLGYNYHGLSLNSDVKVHFNELYRDHFEIFNVRYVVAPADHPLPDFVQPLSEFGRHRLYQVKTNGYFDLVSSDVGFSGDKGDFYSAAAIWMFSRLPSAKQYPAVFFEAAPDLGISILPLAQAAAIIPQLELPPEPPGGRGQVLSEEIGLGDYRARVQAAEGSSLLLKVTYHPGWQAWVDGQEVQPFMLMPSYVGIILAPGEHEVHLVYQPGPLRGLLFILGLFVLALVGLVEWRWRARTDRPLDGKFDELALKADLAVQRVLAWGPLRRGWEPLRPHLPYLGILLLLVLLVGGPLLQSRIMAGHDAREYLPRAVEFYEGLKSGQLFPRWAPDLSMGYGQPFFNFNPPFFYYLASFFHMLGSNFVTSQNLALLTILILAGLGLYLLAGEFFGPRGGLLTAAAYLLAPYLLSALYVRHALADFSAFAWIPFTFWGLYRYAREGGIASLLIGALALAFLLLSSNPVALITFPFLLLFLGLVAYSQLSWRALGRGLWCLGLGLSLAAFFWIPALGERDLVHLERLKTGYLSYSNHFVYPLQFITSPWGYGLSLPGIDDGMSFAIGWLHILMAIAALLLLRRVYARSRQGALIAAFSLVLLLSAAFLASQPSIWIWQRLPLLQFLEFPWRYLSLVAVGAALLFGAPFLLLKDRDRLAGVLLAILVIGLLLLELPKAGPEKYMEETDADYSPQAIAAGNLSVTTAREYEPIWVQESPQTPAGEAINLLEGTGNLLSTRLSPTLIQAQARITQPARLKVNTFYFPDWKLFVNGVEQPVDYSNPQGVMEFSLEPGEHWIQVVFEDTIIRRWSKYLSLFALIMLILTFVFRRVNISDAVRSIKRKSLVE